MGILRIAAVCLLVLASCNVVDTRSDQFDCSNGETCPDGRTCVDGECVVSEDAPDAMPGLPDAEPGAPDAEPPPDAPVGPGLAIPCGTAGTCAVSCCVTGGTFECDVAACGGDLLECNDEGDCAGSQECCVVGGVNTSCVGGGNCDLDNEVCENQNDCSEEADGCQANGNDPFPTCVPD